MTRVLRDVTMIVSPPGLMLPQPRPARDTLRGKARNATGWEPLAAQATPVGGPEPTQTEPAVRKVGQDPGSQPPGPGSSIVMNHLRRRDRPAGGRPGEGDCPQNTFCCQYDLFDNHIWTLLARFLLIAAAESSRLSSVANPCPASGRGDAQTGISLARAGNGDFPPAPRNSRGRRSDFRSGNRGARLGRGGVRPAARDFRLGNPEAAAGSRDVRSAPCGADDGCGEAGRVL